MSSEYAGMTVLGETLNVGMQTRSGDTPTDADSLPTFRVYGQSGLLANAGGTAAFRHTGSVTGATNASPIVITSAGHGLSTGMRVTISGVLGNTAANGTFIVTRLTADTFSIPTAGTGAYTSGGTWHASGLYYLPIAATEANGLESGQSYAVHASWQVSASAYAEVFTFTVL